MNIVAAVLAATLFMVFCSPSTAQVLKKPPPPKAGQTSTPSDSSSTQLEKVPEKRGAQIDRNGVLILVRSILVAVDQANKTNNYSVLLALGAPLYQQGGIQKLSEAFRPLREGNIDLSGVTVFTPELSETPYIDPLGRMHINGFFPAVGRQIVFEIQFAPIDGQWKLFGIDIRLMPTAPVAPKAP